jgi:poly(beta-D-mannuronate) lyase
MASMVLPDKWFRRILVPSLALAGMAGCDSGFLDDPWTMVQPARLERPGVVLFDPQARHAALAAMASADRDFLCGPPEDEWRSFKAVTRPKAPGSSEGRSAEPFAMEVMRATAWAVASHDHQAIRAVVRVMDRWAKGAALTEVDETANQLYAVNRTVLPIIVSWAALKGELAKDREKTARIERWLADLMQLRRQMATAAGKTTSRNNHHYLNASVDMAWGALTGEQDMFDHGVAAYMDALTAMRADGSLPLETRRGARALWYQRHAIASLVTIAEIAAVQGVDLYGREVDGRSIHTAIRFLTKAVEDPRLVLGYAAENHNPGTSADWHQQDRTFLQTRGHGRHYMAWVEPYRARFPARAEARALSALLATYDPHFQPAIDDYSGGNMSCFFARPPSGLVNSQPDSPPPSKEG